MRSFVSTRGQSQPATAKQAIWQGLAPDGGLYTPEDISDLTFNLEQIADLTYQETAEKILGAVLNDYSNTEIHHTVTSAYTDSFTTPDVTPLTALGPHHLLELYHGPTSAFKDVALTALPHLLTQANPHTGPATTYILTATSGDTGKAALEGFADVPGTYITVFYPAQGVSAVQEKQMRATTGTNTQVLAINGNFDDCQRLAKECSTDRDLAALGQGMVQLSSANSINAGRLFPQVVYYFRACAALQKQGKLAPGDTIDVVVPTGNFGNILAGYYAKLMGCPIGKLICASNRNNVLTEFIRTGIYDRNRPLYKTTSPSMDILISSNLERLLFLLSGQNTELVRGHMEELAHTGRYQVSDELLALVQENFDTCTADEDQCAAAIRHAWDTQGVLIDPHTAVAYHAVVDRKEPCIILSTASAYKFPHAVLTALQGNAPDNDFDGIEELHTMTNVPIPAHLATLRTQPEHHSQQVSMDQARQLVAGKMWQLAEELRNHSPVTPDTENTGNNSGPVRGGAR